MMFQRTQGSQNQLVRDLVDLGVDLGSDVLAAKQLSLIEELCAMALVNNAKADFVIASRKMKDYQGIWKLIVPRLHSSALQNMEIDSSPAIAEGLRAGHI